jgi:Fur family peroxide stress response transcriptional regulator
MQERQRTEKLRQFEALCRSKGLPLTVQRRAIFEAVLERDDHPRADQVLEVVQERIPGVSRTTVYRVLDTLVDLGVVRRVQSTGNAIRFDGKTDRHDHLICRQCGRMADLETSELNELPLPKRKPQGFQIDDYTVQFTGTCAECRKAKK